MRVRHQVHDVFFQVRARARNDLHFVLTDHLCKRDAKLGGTHRTCKRDHHLSTFGKMGFIPLCCVDERCSIEVTVVVFDELGYWTALH